MFGRSAIFKSGNFTGFVHNDGEGITVVAYKFLELRIVYKRNPVEMDFVENGKGRIR